MGNTDSTQRLGERVLAGQRKFDQDKAIQSERYEYLASNSPEMLEVMVKSVEWSFESYSPFLEPILLIAYKHSPETCKKIVLNACRKVLSAPIEKKQYEWFREYVFSSSVWMFKTKVGRFMYKELLDIAKNMSADIIDSMDSIYNHLETHSKWKQIIDIKNQAAVLRQDHEKVGLLKEQALYDIFESKTMNDENDEKTNDIDNYNKAENMKSFIDSNLAINILMSAAANINNEFQHHVKTVMSRYGDFRSGPVKKVERCVGKLENDYQDAAYPKCAKLLDLIRCSVTFNTLDQLIVGYHGLMKHIIQNNGIVELARVKNGFLEKGAGGYRDLKVCVVYKSQINPDLNMICEIQLMLINYLQEKKRIHKLYSIVRDELYFQMVGQEEDDKDIKNVTDLQFTECLNVGKDLEIKLEYSEPSLNKCSIDPELGLLAMEGINWLGIVDIKQKKAIHEMKREAPKKPWYGRNSHKWIIIEDEKYLSVQMCKNEIKMFKIIAQNDSYRLSEADERFTITLPTQETINYCDFDTNFESILLIINYTTLQKRPMKNINDVSVSLVLEEKINQSSFRNLALSNDGNFCALGGGGYKNYFYVIDIDKNEQYKMTSSVLQDTYAPCFINGKNKYISVSDKRGKIEIWDIERKQPFKTLYIGVSQWVTSSTSINNILAVGSWDKQLRLYDVRNWECFYVRKYNIKPNALDLTKDLKYLTCGGVGREYCVVLNIE